MYMQCQICNKNDATIHLTEIADGVRAEMHICEHCSQRKNYSLWQSPFEDLHGHEKANKAYYPPTAARSGGAKRRLRNSGKIARQNKEVRDRQK
jgi:hypothetical protein